MELIEAPIDYSGATELIEAPIDYSETAELIEAPIDRAVNDVLVPWTLNDKKYDRYYHLFVKNELDLLINVKKGVITKSFFEKDNWIIIFKKISG